MEYASLCEAYKAIEETSARLEKTRIISSLLRNADKDLDRVIVLLQGRVFPAHDKRTLGVSSQIMLKALARVSGTDSTALERAWSDKGDLGLVAEQYITGKSQQTLFSQELTVAYAHEQLKRLASIEGQRSVDTKLKILSDLFSAATPLEARYLTRTVLETLRIGIASQTIRDGITYAFLSDQAGITEGEIADREAYNTITLVVQAAYDKTNDFTRVAQAAKHGVDALTEVGITINTPLKVMLGLRGESVEQAMEDLGTPVMLQYKYDGFRVEIHKEGESVTVYTRRLENVTEQFPDIVERVKKHVHCQACILDGEAIGVDPATGRYRPFQAISQRIRRKHGIKQMAEKLPVDVRIFDITYRDGEELLDTPLSERHAILEEIITPHERFGTAHTLITSSVEDAKAFYDQALADGEEGLFAKKLDSPYQPGTRVGNWIKLKSTLEPLDVVIVGAEWGEGKRSGWLSSYTIAVRDEEGNLLEVGRVATGLKEKPEEGFSFGEMTDLLSPLIEREEGRYVWVKPAIVIEVAYEEIQESPQYASGYGLRFPRIIRNRTDERGPDEASTLKLVEQLYAQQRGRSA